MDYDGRRIGYPCSEFLFFLPLSVEFTEFDDNAVPTKVLVVDEAVRSRRNPTLVQDGRAAERFEIGFPQHHLRKKREFVKKNFGNYFHYIKLNLQIITSKILTDILLCKHTESYTKKLDILTY